MLKLAAQIQGKHAVVAACAEATVAVEASGIRAPEIVNVRLAEMKAIAQGRPGDAHDPLIYGLELCPAILLVERNAHIRLQLFLNRLVNVDGFVVRAAGDSVRTGLQP